MSKPYTPGGRFDTDFEHSQIHDAITKDLTNPVGSEVLWYQFNSATTVVDPIYDVGSSAGVGRQWYSPILVPVIRSVIKHGTVEHSREGFYNADSLHITIDKQELSKALPTLFTNPDPLNRDRIVWQGQVYRPLLSQLRGIVLEKFTVVSLDCRQIMPEEMVNDSQFQDYASSITLYGEGTYGYGTYGG